VGVDGVNAVMIACTSSTLKVDSAPIPPILAAIAFCNRASVEPFLAVLPKAPWQLAHWAE
jgi:hypothetical protein